MPFPLAHPAAVLPLTRYCPRYLSFPALLIGSVATDAAYFVPFLSAEEWSHSGWGVIGFALPVGLLGLALLYGADRVIRRLSPKGWIWSSWPTLSIVRSPVVIVFSLLVGGFTHFLWDSFTHRSGWIVERSAFLQLVVAQFGNRSVRVCHLLWYLSSFLGMIWVWMALEAWVLSAKRSARTTRCRFLDGLILATLFLPVEILHHNLLGRWGLALAGGLTLALTAGAAMRLARLAGARSETVSEI